MAAAVEPVNNVVGKHALGSQTLLKHVVAQSYERRCAAVGEEKKAVGIGSGGDTTSGPDSGYDDPDEVAKRRAMHRAKTRRSSFGGVVSPEGHNDMMGALMRARTKMYENKDDDKDDDDDDDDDDSTEDGKDQKVDKSSAKEPAFAAVKLKPATPKSRLTRQDQQNLPTVDVKNTRKKRDNELVVERKDTRSVTVGSTSSTAAAAEVATRETSRGMQRVAADRGSAPRAISRPPIAPAPTATSPAPPVHATPPARSDRPSKAAANATTATATTTKVASAAPPIVATREVKKAAATKEVAAAPNVAVAKEIPKTATPAPTEARTTTTTTTTTTAAASATTAAVVSSESPSHRRSSRDASSRTPDDEVKLAVSLKAAARQQAPGTVSQQTKAPKKTATPATALQPTSQPPLSPSANLEPKPQGRLSRLHTRSRSRSRAQSLDPAKDDDTEKSSTTGKSLNDEEDDSPQGHHDSRRARMRQRLHSLTDCRNKLTVRVQSLHRIDAVP